MQLPSCTLKGKIFQDGLEISTLDPKIVFGGVSFYTLKLSDTIPNEAHRSSTIRKLMPGSETGKSTTKPG